MCKWSLNSCITFSLLHTFTICSIVQSFERIVNALISQENFTNLTIIQTDIAFQGLRVRESIIIACTNSLSTHMQIQRTDFMGITFIESSSSKNYIIYLLHFYYLFPDSSLSIKTVIEADHIQESDNTRIQIKESIANVTKKDYINIAFTLYNQSTLFPIREPPPDTTVGSSIISASVDGIPEGTTLPENVTINFTIAEKVYKIIGCMVILLFLRMPPIIVVYFGISQLQVHYTVFSMQFKLIFAGGRGNWSVRGCTTIVINASYVTCICNHLTNFACLVVSGRYHVSLFERHFTLYIRTYLQGLALLHLQVLELLWKLLQ